MEKEKKPVKEFKSKVIHNGIVKKVEGLMQPEELLYELADFFNVLGDTTRVKILSALAINEMCVYDLAFLLKMNQSAVSHQLRVLKQARLVKPRKEGKMVYYSLNDEHVDMILRQGLDHVKERK